MKDQKKLLKEIRWLLYAFIIGLILSGITAFPIHTELTFAHNMITYFELDNPLSLWIETVYKGVHDVDSRYPFMAYGTDWLAYAHIILAVLFLGIVKDPIKNIWVLQFGLISCAGIFPLAIIAGHARGIPMYWQLIDCSFGLVGGTILWMCFQRAKIVSAKNDLSIRTPELLARD